MEQLSEIIYNSLTNNKLLINAPSIEGDILENVPVIRNSKYKGGLKYDFIIWYFISHCFDASCF